MRPSRLRKPSIARPIRALLVLSAIFIRTTAAAQQGPADTALGPRIEAMVSQAKLPPQVALSIVDIETGRSVVSLNAQTPLNPASNLKLVTAAAALRVLGPDFRMQTGLYGHVRQERTEALCLK